MSLSDFLQMGGYAGYVWSSFGLTVLVLVGLEWSGRTGLRQAQRHAARRAQIGETK